MTARRTRCAYFVLILVDGFEDIVNRRELEPLAQILEGLLSSNQLII